MALRFRTPHIDELPTYTQTRQAPGFAYVAVTASEPHPAAPPNTVSNLSTTQNWGTTARKRARHNVNADQHTDAAKEALSARQQRDIERKIRDLNNDRSNREIAIPANPGAGGGAKAGAMKNGKTLNTKRVLGSGKTIVHFLDDEEAEIARTGRRDGEVEVVRGDVEGTGVERVKVEDKRRRWSKTPIARRRGEEASSQVGANDDVEMVDGEGEEDGEKMEEDEDADEASLPPIPSRAEIEALWGTPVLSFNQAKTGPRPTGAPPARKFCETCGYWGRVKCTKCGVMVCSVECKDAHDQFKCLKMYA